MLLYLFSPQELAPNEDQGIVYSALDVPANASIEQLLPYTDQIGKIFQTTPEFDHSLSGDQPSPRAASSGVLVETLGRCASADLFDPGRARRQAVEGHRRPRARRLAVRRSSFRAPSRRVHRRLDGRARGDQVRFVQLIVDEAAKSGQFAFLRSPTSASIRRRARSSSTATRWPRWGSRSPRSAGILGGDARRKLRGTTSTSTAAPTRSSRRSRQAGRLSADRLQDIYITGPDNKLVPLGAVATLRRGIEPRTLNRFQQLNSIRVSGVATRSLDQGLKVLEEASKRILPQGYHTDYTGESRQLRSEGGKFLPAMGRAILLIFLVLAAQFNSFRDPFVVLRGLGPARDVRRAHLHVPEILRPARDAFRG